MTQSIPFSSSETALTQHNFKNGVIPHPRLMELVEAEDATNGEIGCGRYLGREFLVYLDTKNINISYESFSNLLRENLGHLLMEIDFDSITTQVRRFIESIVMQKTAKQLQNLSVRTEQVIEYINNEELRRFFQAELDEFFTEEVIEQMIQFTHQVIHETVLQPRHTWPNPVWVLTTGQKIYITQAPDLEDAINQVKTQYPQETQELEVLTVGGMLNPHPVIALDIANLS